MADKLNLNQGILPMVEGKCSPVKRLKADGTWESYYPEPTNEPDENITETETYAIEDKEEFYDYVTKCKKCGTEFIAYFNTSTRTNNYCPHCGGKLKNA